DAPVALRFPGQWFRLEADKESFAEIATGRPGLGASVLAVAEEKDAKLVSVPFTSIAKGDNAILSLVFDIPKDLDKALLVIGAREMDLIVTTRTR
ncbi:MAG: hypothetical protein ACAI25_14005, partial [Planctomycetota bacterium]